MTYSIFQVDVRNLVKNKLAISREYHVQPSEIDKLQFYEYEMYLDEINRDIKEQEKRKKEQEKEQKASMPNMGNIMRTAQSSMPKMPTMPSMPKF